MGFDSAEAKLLGNIGQDLVLQRNGNNVASVFFSVAVNGTFYVKSATPGEPDEKRKSTTWVKVVAFGSIAEHAAQFLRKGSKVFLEGKLNNFNGKAPQSEDQYVGVEVLLTRYAHLIKYPKGYDFATVNIVGNIGKDLQVKTNEAGKSSTFFSIAVNSSYNDVSKTTWIPGVAFDKIAQSAGENLVKGTKVLIIGRLNNSEVTAPNSDSKYTATEVVPSTFITIISYPKSYTDGMDDDNTTKGEPAKVVEPAPDAQAPAAETQEPVTEEKPVVSDNDDDTMPL